MLLRERRRLAVVITALAVAAPLAFASAAQAAAGGASGSSGAGDVLATLKVTSPKVEVKKQDASAFKVAKDGAKLREGDTVRTDATGLAEIDYGNDAYTRLDVNTEFTITKLTDEQGARQVQGSLEVGQTWNRTAAITESGSFEQEGAGANAAVRGTAFTVSCDAPDHCTFIAIEHTTALTGTDGVTKDLTPRVACDSTDGDLCDATRTLTIDELAANDWIQNNLIRDLTERGVGDGPFVPVNVTLTVEDGHVVSVEPGSPPAPEATEPGAPTNVSATGANGAAIVSFDPPASNGGSPITGYLVTATPVGGGLFAAAEEGPHFGTGPGSPIVVGGLTNTVTYVFTVTAQNAVGASPSSEPSNEVTPVGDAPVIDANPVNISSFGGDTTPGEVSGANSRIVAQDERTVTFTLQVTNPEGGTYWIVFTDLPAADFGTIYDHTNTAVTTGTHYDPTEVFTFDPVEIEPVCNSAEPTTFADCFTNGDPSEGPQAGSGTVPYPSTVTEGPVDGSVQWSDSFTFHAENDQGGVSDDTTVELVAVDDICTTGSEGFRPASAVVTCPSL